MCPTSSRCTRTKLFLKFPRVWCARTWSRCARTKPGWPKIRLLTVFFPALNPHFSHILETPHSLTFSLFTLSRSGHHTPFPVTSDRLYHRNLHHLHLYNTHNHNLRIWQGLVSRVSNLGIFISMLVNLLLILVFHKHNLRTRS